MLCEMQLFKIAFRKVFISRNLQDMQHTPLTGSTILRNVTYKSKVYDRYLQLLNMKDTSVLYNSRKMQ